MVIASRFWAWLDARDAARLLERDWEPWSCVDCGMPTHPCEQYMVHDVVWQAAGAPREASGFFLCVGCLEERVGRVLVPADFSACILNDDSEFDSVRLRARKGSGRRLEDLQSVGVEAVRLGVAASEVASRLGLDAEMIENLAGS